MSPVPPTPVTRATVPAGMSVAAVAREFVRLALGLDEHAAVATGRDADLDIGVVSDEIARRERLGRRCPAEGAEDEPGDRPGRRCRSAADRRRLAAVDVEHLRGEQPADPEHRDERQQQRHEAHAADVEVEDGAQDVVDEDGDQQQPATDQEADDEDEVLDRDVDHRRRGLPRPARARREDRIATREPAARPNARIVSRTGRTAPSASVRAERRRRSGHRSEGRPSPARPRATPGRPSRA